MLEGELLNGEKCFYEFSGIDIPTNEAMDSLIYDLNYNGRYELILQPKLLGLMGPFYNGIKDGCVVIRYEMPDRYMELGTDY